MFYFEVRLGEGVVALIPCILRSWRENLNKFDFDREIRYYHILILEFRLIQ